MRLFCRLFFFFFLILFWVGAAYSESFYIAPALEVPLRSGTDFSKKIVAVLKDGTRVELLKEEGPWAFVQTPKGKKGWILKRFLSSELPPKLRVERLKELNKKLTEENRSLKEKVRNGLKQLDECQKKFNVCIDTREKITNDFNELKKDAAGVLETKRLLLETQKRLEKVDSERLKLKQQLSSIKANSNIKWFLAGGGVLLIGWILGLISNKRRRRRPSLL